MLSFYHAKTNPISGTSYITVAPPARRLLRTIARRTKRKPYLRSKFFRKEKVFLTFFWDHLMQLPRYQRVKYLPCAVDLILHSQHAPEIYRKRDQPGETFYRFSGIAANGAKFAVQIKESKRGRKEFMSVFPYKQNPPPK